jgi:type 1 fimbriae regulatory protein FimB
MSKGKKIKYFDDYEVKKFFAVVKKEGNIRNLLFFKFLYHYGMRISECVSIELADIKPDLKQPLELYVRRIKEGISRHYPLNFEDAKILSRWLRKRKSYPNAEGNDFLFITSRSLSAPMTDHLAKKLHLKYCTLADLPTEKRTNIHAWRHTCAISLLMSGKDIYFIKSWLGHKSLQSSLIYLEIAPPQWNQLAKDAIRNSFVV